MRKYYLEKQRHPGYPHDTFENNLILNSPTEQITVSEDVDWPNIEFSVGLLEQSVWKRPQNTEFSKFKEISQEDFLNYLTVSMEYLKKLKCKNCEAYIIQVNHTSYDVGVFSDAPKNKFFLTFELMYSLEELYLMFYVDNKLNQRNRFRKEGTLISQDITNHLLFKTIEYIGDDKNYVSNSKILFKDYAMAYEGTLTPEISDNSMNIAPLITRLTNQISQLEFRLLNNDSDKKSTREKIRGEIKGLKTAINEIKKFLHSLPKQ